MTLVLCFTVAEIVMRVAMTENEARGNYWGRGAFAAHATAGYMHAPGYVGTAQKEGSFTVEVRIDDHGLHQEDFEAQNAYQQKILFLGDSYTFGLGLEAEQAHPMLLRNNLDPRGIGVINGGQTGYSVRQEAAFGAGLIDEVRPDIVVLKLFLQNDVDADHLGDLENIDVRWGIRLRKDRWLPWAPFDWLRTRSYAALFLNKRIENILWKKRRSRFHELALENPGVAAAETIEAVRSIKGMTAAAGGRLVVVILPSGKYFEKHFKWALRAMGLPLLLLELDDFSQGDYFLTDAHWNAFGNAKAAALIETFLDAHILASSPK
jgi:hypothetical protein